MKFKIIAFVIVNISSVAVLIQAQSAIFEAEAKFPTCALKCMITLIPQSSCNITDLPCICSNAPLNANISICATSTCANRELLTAQNISMTFCGAEVRDKTNQVSYIGVGGGIVALVAFLLRMYSRLLKGTTGRQNIGLDDAMMCLLVYSPFFYYYLGENFYLAAIAVNKIVLLIFIFRVIGDSTFRKYIFSVMALCTGYGVSFVFATIFQCNPVSYSWQSWDGEHQGTCHNIHLQGWTSAAFNIVLDIMVILLPMPKLFKLNMSWKKKAMVLWMFSLGIFVTVVSIVRLRSLVQFADSQNFTWDYVPAAYWSTIELHLGIVCASLPAVRSLLAHAFPKILDSTKGQSANNTETSRKYTSSNGQTGYPFAISKGPYSASSDPFRSTERFNFVPLVDVERQIENL